MQKSDFSGQTVLIAGASGFIGSHLCKRLAEFDNVEIHALSRVRRDDTTKIRWWEGDVIDAAMISSLLRSVKPDYIFNLASHVMGSRDISMVIPTFQSNLGGQVYLMTEACKAGCKRFITTGSMDEPSGNNLQDKTVSPYAIAKWAAGVYGEMFHALYGLPYVHLRVFMVYGPGQQDMRKLIPYSILSMLNGNPPNLASGRRKIDWIYIEDVVDGILAAALTPNIEGAKLDIGSGKALSISAIEEILIDLINPNIKPNFGARSDRLFEQEPIANVSVTYQQIHWKPKVSMHKGLKKTVEWYRNNIHLFNGTRTHS
jgi:UDP-glucose 4-epimerase